jgi:hypothetical protein
VAIKTKPSCMSLAEYTELREYAKEKLGVKPRVYLVKDLGEKEFGYPIDGLCNYTGNVIKLTKGLSKADFIHTYLHECVHLYCYRNNIFPKYHYHSTLTSSDFTAYKKTAVRAELWVDRKARHLAYDLYPTYYPEHKRSALSKHYKENVFPFIEKNFVNQ